MFDFHATAIPTQAAAHGLEDALWLIESIRVVSGLCNSADYYAVLRLSRHI